MPSKHEYTLREYKVNLFGRLVSVYNVSDDISWTSEFLHANSETPQAIQTMEVELTGSLEIAPSDYYAWLNDIGGKLEMPHTPFDLIITKIPKAPGFPVRTDILRNCVVNKVTEGIAKGDPKANITIEFKYLRPETV